MPKMQI